MSYQYITMSKYESIIDKGEKCFMCGVSKNYTTLTPHHTLFGAQKRCCDEDRLIVALCFECHRKVHDNAKLAKQYRRLGQMYYEKKIGTRREFVNRYKGNYMED